MDDTILFTPVFEPGQVQAFLPQPTVEEQLSLLFTAKRRAISLVQEGQKKRVDADRVLETFLHKQQRAAR